MERFTRLYRAFLSQGDAQAWERYESEIPPSHKRHFDALQQTLRLQYHQQQALDRRTKLASLLAQTPAFSFSDADRAACKTREGQRKRHAQVARFVSQHATKSAVGVHPFFASLKRLLEYQGCGRLDRCCQWLFDDAVLMETGGDEWMASAVWILKGVSVASRPTIRACVRWQAWLTVVVPWQVLHFEEQGPCGEDPFIGENESLRRWTVAAHLNDPECRRLARLIPSYVLPRRGRGSDPIERTIADEESVKDVALPTGKLSISDTFRDRDHRGSLLERLWGWLMARWG